MYSSLTQNLILGGLSWSLQMWQRSFKIYYDQGLFSLLLLFLEMFSYFSSSEEQEERVSFTMSSYLLRFSSEHSGSSLQPSLCVSPWPHQVAKCKESCVCAPCIGCVSDAHICEVQSSFLFVFPSCPLPLSSLFWYLLSCSQGEILIPQRVISWTQEGGA